MQHSLVKKSQLNDSMRIDAEHYSPRFFPMLKLLAAKQHMPLSEILSRSVITGHTPSKSNESFYVEGKIKFVKTDNLRSGYVDFEGVDLITESGNAEIKQSELKNDDVIVTIIGATESIVGRAARIFSDIGRANINQNIALIRSKWPAGYIVSYLNSKYGRDQLHWLSRQTEQVNLNCREVELLQFPKFDDDFIALIENINTSSYRYSISGKQLFAKAENLLLSGFGLIDWRSKHRLSYAKKFSDTQTANRIDAEYYQPMYEEITEALTKHGHVQRLGDLVTIKKCVEPGSEAYQEEGIPFVRVSNLSKFEINNNNQQYLSEELYNELKENQPAKGEILLSKDATPGIAYYLADKPTPMIPSSGILRLGLNDKNTVNPEYLTLVLNAVTTQKQIERDVGGSIIIHWLPDQVKNTLIPILDIKKQQTIGDIVNKSSLLYQQSKALLEIATRGVEMAIEQNEKAAEQWINNQLTNLDVQINS